MSKLTVIGSVSIDLVVTSKRRPAPGETVAGDSFATVPGGKGANQAVAASRLGAETIMIGRIGEDAYGKEIFENLHRNGVNTRFVLPAAGVPSGTAHITLAEGDNSIIIVKGANNAVTPEYIEQARSAIEEADIVLVQQEIPEESVEYAAKLCTELRKPLMLNPAPARPVSQAVLKQAAYITPNEHEFALLFPGEARSEVLRAYPNKLFITEGVKGVRYFDGTAEKLVPAYPVETVDTTGAGDTFNAAFAVALAEGMTTDDSLAFANKAAALSVMKFGAQGGMPLRRELDQLLGL